MAAGKKNNVEIFESAALLNKAAAQFIITIAKKAITARGKFIISLSGGETPKKLFTLLATPAFTNRIDWKKTFVFWGDERCVPLNDERNNAFQARSLILDKIDIPASNIHIIPVNLSSAEAASAYEQTVNLFFGKAPRRFDLILLGLGENGHSASLFPGTKILNDKTEGIREVFVEEDNMFRISMTAALINHARNILFLVSGQSKAIILNKVLNGPYQPTTYPAQLIKPANGSLYWFVDRDAASLLPA